MLPLSQLVLIVFESLCNLFDLSSTGLCTCGCNARTERPHKLHPPPAASPSLYVPSVCTLPHPAAGQQPLPSYHRWCPVSEQWHPFIAVINTVKEPLRYFYIMFRSCILMVWWWWTVLDLFFFFNPQVLGYSRTECQWYSEVQQCWRSPGDSWEHTEAPSLGPYCSGYTRSGPSQSQNDLDYIIHEWQSVFSKKSMKLIFVLFIVFKYIFYNTMWKCWLLWHVLLKCLGCYPFYQKDPFILEDCPHVYFSGNAPSYQCKRITGKEKNI